MAKAMAMAMAMYQRTASTSEMLADWHRLSRVQSCRPRNGWGDLYPFTLVEPVQRKLDFLHRVVIEAVQRIAGTPVLV